MIRPPSSSVPRLGGLPFARGDRDPSVRGLGYPGDAQLRATLEELREDVRPEHRAAVEKGLARLDSTVAAHWGETVDLDLAMVADGQGIGGPGLAARS